MCVCDMCIEIRRQHNHLHATIFQCKRHMPPVRVRIRASDLVCFCNPFPPIEFVARYGTRNFAQPFPPNRSHSRYHAGLISPTNNFRFRVRVTILFD